MNDSREISEREVKLMVSAAPESPMELDIRRQLADELKGECKAHEETISDLEAALREVAQLKVQVQTLIGVVATLAHEKAKLSGIIEDAKLVFAEINRRAQVLANTVDELREMMNQ